MIPTSRQLRALERSARFQCVADRSHALAILRDIESKQEHPDHAGALFELARIASYLPIHSVLPLVFSDLTATIESSQRGFQTLHALGWVLAQHGRTVEAIGLWREARNHATSDAQICLVLADSAFVLHAVHRSPLAAIDLADAKRHAELADWDTATPQSQLALVILSALSISIDNDPTTARSLFSAYGELQPPRSPLLYALGAYFTSIIDYKLLGRREAIEDLSFAQELFELLESDFWIGQCLLQRFRLTRNSELLDAAQTKLRPFSAEWMAIELAGTTSDITRRGLLPPISLTRMQETVLEGICLGKPYARIAKDLNISINTVTNHGQAIFRKFNVNSRVQLVLEAGKRGMMPTARQFDANTAHVDREQDEPDDTP